MTSGPGEPKMTSSPEVPWMTPAPVIVGTSYAQTRPPPPARVEDGWETAKPARRAKSPINVSLRIVEPLHNNRSAIQRSPALAGRPVDLAYRRGGMVAADTERNIRKIAERGGRGLRIRYVVGNTWDGDAAAGSGGSGPMPAARAAVAAAVRVLTPSLAKMLPTWVWTVRGLMKSASAIPRSVWPATRRWRTSNSRRE